MTKNIISSFPLLALLLFTQPSWAHPLDSNGGVSGGGGNVLDATPPTEALDVETAEDLVKASLKYVRYYVQEKENHYRSGQMSVPDKEIYSKIFEGKSNIKNAIQKIQPKVVDEGPCYDYDRQPVDASVVSHKPNTFCVSAHSLARKVIHTEIPIQSTALMIHEYSELVGLSEEEAVVIQKKSLEDLKNMTLPPL